VEDIKNIIESLLFVADEPLTIDRFKQILNQPETKQIRSTLEEISAEYQERQGGFYLHEVAGGFQIRTRPEYTPWIKRLIQPKPSRLSKAALETLAIVAYKQPIIRSDIENVRGVDCGGVLKVLLERGFLRVMGRKEIPGRPLIYGTTKRFLEVFDLKTLKDLPSPKEIEELGDASMETVQQTVNGDTQEAQEDTEDASTAKNTNPEPDRMDSIQETKNS
jgi:segregation and condensation protein B